MHALFLLFAVGLLSSATAKFTQTPYLDQSFFFDWSTAGAGTTTVAQCESLNITWERGSATGPNPTAPYTLSVFTSTFVVPLAVNLGSSQSFSWPVPFIPGTQLQLCMFDANGNTGGCQRQVTVYPSLNQSPTCTNFTYPHSQLEVDGQVDNGPISQYGWPDQCTDIQLTPKNGTPPYMMTVATTLHPPYNITVDSMSSVNWTIALSWGSPFWVSLVDSKGFGWSNGPMHSGGSGTSSCLTKKSDKEGVSPYATVGAGIGGTLLGLLVGLLGAFCLNRRFARRAKPSFTQEPIDGFDGGYAHHALATGSHMGGAVNSVGQLHAAGSPYKVEPWIPTLGMSDPSISPAQSHAALQKASSTSTLPSGAAAPQSMNTMVSSVPSMAERMPQSGPASDGSPDLGAGDSLARNTHQIYVVHHDGGRAPVTVYTADGTEVVELPPSYDGQGRSSPRATGGEGTAAGASALQPQMRTPGGVRKTRPENTNSGDGHGGR